MRVVAFALALAVTLLSTGCVSVAANGGSEYVTQIIQALQSDGTTAVVFGRSKQTIDSIVIGPVAFCNEPNIALLEMLQSTPTVPAGVSVDSLYSSVVRIIAQDRYCTDDSTSILERISPFRNTSARPVLYISRPYPNVVNNLTMVTREVYMAGAVDGSHNTTAALNGGSFVSFIALFESGRLKEFVTGRAEP